MWDDKHKKLCTRCCLWAQGVVYEHKMLFMSIRWVQDDAHRCCLWAQDEHRWAQDDAHRCCLWAQMSTRWCTQMLFMSTRWCTRWAQDVVYEHKKHKKQLSSP